jgi:hypothetical protein
VDRGNGIARYSCSDHATRMQDRLSLKTTGEIRRSARVAERTQAAKTDESSDEILVRLPNGHGPHAAQKPR